MKQSPAGPTRDRPFPEVPKALLESLERLFPKAMPTLEEPERSIWMRVGQQEIIGLLRMHYNRQNTPS